MGQTQTALLILSIIFILGAIAYTIQSIEERKRARKLLLMSYKSQIRTATNMYNSFPDAFITTELHDFISRYVLKKWKQLHALEMTPESQRSLATFQKQVKERVLDQLHPEDSMTVYSEPGQVHHALGILKETSKWLAGLSKSKQISELSFNELGWQTKDFYDRISCDIEIFEAMETEQMSGAKSAFHKFNIALKSLKNLNQSQALDSQIFTIHKHMANLKLAIEEQEEADEIARIEAQEAAEEAALRDRS